MEPVEIEHVCAEHRSRPDDDEQRGEEDAGNVGSNFGGAELADHDVQGRSVVEMFALFKIELSLRIGKNAEFLNIEDVAQFQMQFQIPLGREKPAGPAAHRNLESRIKNLSASVAADETIHSLHATECQTSVPCGQSR